MVSFEFMQIRQQDQKRAENAYAQQYAAIPDTPEKLDAEIQRLEEHQKTTTNLGSGVQTLFPSEVARRISILREARDAPERIAEINQRNQQLRSEGVESIYKTSSASASVGGGQLGGTGAGGARVVSTSAYEDKVRAGYTGSATVDPRVSDIFKVPETAGLFGVPPTPTRSAGGGPLPSSLPQASALTTIDGKKIGAKAGIKSVIPPVQNRELRGSTITARQLQQIRAGKLTESEALNQNARRGAPTINVNIQSSKILPQALPSSRTSASIPGVSEPFPNLLPSASAESNIDFSGPINAIENIKRQGGKQVTITTPSGKQVTTSVDKALDVFKQYPEKGQFNIEFFGAKTQEQRQAQKASLKGTQGKFQDIINEARSIGAKDITIIDDKGKRTTVPIQRAFYDITKISRTSPALSFEFGGLSSEQKQINVDARKQGVTQISDFVNEAKKNFADTIIITNEDGTSRTVGIGQATKEIRKATVSGQKVSLSYTPLPKPITTADVFGKSPITEYLDKTF